MSRDRKLSEIYENKMNEELAQARDLMTKMSVETEQLKNALNALKENWYMEGITKEIRRLSWELANDSGNLENARRNAIQYENYKKEALQDEIDRAAGITV